VSEEFVRRSTFAVPAADLYGWHLRPGALERLSPPWERVDVERDEGVGSGSRTELRVRLGPFRRRWIAEHELGPGALAFRDRQVEGPFAAWEHLHRVEPAPCGSSLEDRIAYRLPIGPLGALARPLVRRRLDRLFAYRHRVLAQDLDTHARYARRTPMKVLITGASGLVGSALAAYLTSGGHSIGRLVRRAARGSDEIAWDPAGGTIDARGLEGFDAVVHLAGENIAGGRWSAARKERIRASRVDGTRLLAGALARVARKPKVLVSMSATGFYGDRGGEPLDEGASRGEGFLAEVCAAWERAADPAREAGIRVVHPRLGVVLSPRGGALARMLLPFKMGVGGKVGSGTQFLSWITLDDAVAALHHALATDSLAGPVNFVTPSPATNIDFTKALGAVLHRPTVLPLPAFAARLVFGQLADELLLAGQYAVPKALAASGYRWLHPELEPALRHVLGR